jgi:integrase
MSIRKRIWTNSKGEEQLRWQVDYRDNAGNRRSKQFKKKKEAEAWLTSAAWQVSQGMHTADSQSITVTEVVGLWLIYAENEGLERSTVTSYEATARLHIIPFLGKAKLSKLSRPMIEEFRDVLVQTRSRSMAQRAIRYLVQILNEGMRRGLIAFNPAKGVVVKQDRKKQLVIPTKGELLEIIGVCDCEERAFFLTAIFTGLRSSELRGLAWSNINFADNTLTVTQRADSWNDIASPKSNAGNRIIPLPMRTVNALKEWKLACPLSKMNLVFPTKSGTPQSYSNLMKRKIMPVQVKAGVSKLVRTNQGKVKLDDTNAEVITGKYTLHAFRHAAASFWIEQNVDLKRLQSWMGHENIQITIDTYGHLMKDNAKDAAFAAATEEKLFSQSADGPSLAI